MEPRQEECTSKTFKRTSQAPRASPTYWALGELYTGIVSKEALGFPEGCLHPVGQGVIKEVYPRHQNVRGRQMGDAMGDGRNGRFWGALSFGRNPGK